MISKSIDPLKRAYFLLALFIYLTLKLFQALGIVFPDFIQFYLADLLCMPVILTLCLVGVRIIKRVPEFKLTAVMILGMTLFYALFFEWYLPKMNHQYTADYLDAIMYFIGAGIYWGIWEIKGRGQIQVVEE